MVTPVTMREDWWRSVVEPTVKETLSDARKAKREDFDENVEQIGAYLDGLHEDVTDDAFQTYHTAKYDRAKSSVRLEYMPLIPFLTDKLACWLTTPPRVWLSDDLGRPVKRDDPNALNLRSLLRDTNLDDYRWQGERYQAAFRSAFWQVAWREDEIVFDLYRPNILDILESDVDPRRYDWARAIVIPNYMPNWAPSSDTEDYSDRAGTKTVWTRQRLANGSLWWGGFQVDHGGNYIADPPGVFPDGRNRYDRHPIVRWCEIPPVSGVFPPCDDSLLQAQKNCDLMFTDVGEIVSFDSYGIKVAKGINVKDYEIPIDPRVVHKLDDPEASIDIIGPKAKIAEVLQYVNHWLRYQSVFRNLPPELFDLDRPSNTSGVTMAIGRIDLKDARAVRRELMRKNYRRLVECSIVVNNQHVSKRKIDPGLTVNVAFPGEDYSDPATRQAEAQARDFEYKSGARSPVDDYMRDTMQIDPIVATDPERQDAKDRVWSNAGTWAGMTRMQRQDRQQPGRGQDSDSQDER